MVTSMFANSRKCGTAFLHRLAIQFSKTEPNHPPRAVRPRTESLPPRSLEDFRAGSGRGGVDTSAAPHRQEESPKKSSGRLSTGGA
jgi:hypothetical protein